MTQPVLSLENCSKTFGNVRALQSVSIEVRPNEVVGLIGENGAGKSTLLKMLSGVYQPDTGTIRRSGKPITLSSPLAAEAVGIGMVHQEQSLLPNISIAENIFLGREKRFLSLGRVRWAAMHAEARRQLAKVNLSYDPSTRTETLSFADRQMVELAKALTLEDNHDGNLVILLDEPTSVLESAEIKLLFDRVRALRDKASFVFVSHRMDEVTDLADRIYVMRDGKVVGEIGPGEATHDEIHTMMVGRSLKENYYGKQVAPIGAEVALGVKKLASEGAYEDISFDLRRGEILGVAGVVGSGREALLRSLAGLLPPDSGEISVDGKPLTLPSPIKATDAGVGYVPQDRKLEGLVLPLTVAENIALPSLARFRKYGLVSYSGQRNTAQEWVRRLSIRPPNVDLPAQALSGGNQQKVVLSKWIQAGVRILLLDHPTRGVDVGAKQEVYALIRELAGKGLAVLLTADSLEETLGLSDTILVMRDGRISARFDVAKDQPTQIDIVREMV
jgi:ribose transport system ATP-binding protein